MRGSSGVGCPTRYLSVPQSFKVVELTGKAFEDIQWRHEVHQSLSSWQSPEHSLVFRNRFSWPALVVLAVTNGYLALSLRIIFWLFVYLGRSSLQYLRIADRSRARAPTHHPLSATQHLSLALAPENEESGQIKSSNLRLTSALHPQNILQSNASGLSHYSAFPTEMAMVYSAVLRGCIHCFGVSMHHKCGLYWI